MYYVQNVACLMWIAVQTGSPFGSLGSLCSLASVHVESTCEISSILSLVPDSPNHATCLHDRARRLLDMSPIKHQASSVNIISVGTPNDLLRPHIHVLGPPKGPPRTSTRPCEHPKDPKGPSQTLPRDPKGPPKEPKGPPKVPPRTPSIPQDLSEELWDLVSLPEYSQELFEELWTRLMTSKARSHTYRQPVPTQNWFNYIVLIQKYALLIKKW